MRQKAVIRLIGAMPGWGNVGGQMSLEAFYEAVNGDLAGVKSRLLTDERVAKFVGIFFDDPTYSTLLQTMQDGDLPEAFRAAHTLKGVSRDLGFTEISEPATKLADALRPDDSGNPAALEQAPDLLEQVIAAYNRTLDAKGLLD